MTPLSRIAQAAAVATEAVLIVGLLWWCGWAAGLVLSLPLLATLPGLLRARVYTGKWASLLLVFYVAGLLAEGVAMPDRHTAATFLSCVAAATFVSLLLFVRWSAREAQAGLARTAASGDGAAR
jgi:uncharacterized membrane protein